MQIDIVQAVPLSAPLVVIGAPGTLTGARQLLGTSNQIVVTDGGAGVSVTLSLPQNIHTGASPTFAGLTLSGLTAGRIPIVSTAGLLADDSAFVWDNTLKNIGSGVASPLAPLHIVRGTSTYSAFTDAAGFIASTGSLVSLTPTDTSYGGASTHIRGIHSEVISTPAANATRVVLGGALFGAIGSGTSTALAGYTVEGFRARADHFGTSSIATMRGSNVVASMTGTGASATTMIGQGVQVTKGANATTALTTFTGVSATLTNSSATGTITAAIGVDVAITNSGVMTDTIGLRIGDITSGTQTNKAISIHTLDTNAYQLLNGQTFMLKELFVQPVGATAFGSGPQFDVAASPRTGSDDANATIVTIRSKRDATDSWVNSVLRFDAHDGTTDRRAFETLMEGQINSSGTWTNGPWWALFDHINTETIWIYDASNRNIVHARPTYFSSSALSTHATAGIGYFTGAGGTVTQATDKSTGVTLSKMTGAITMNNAALAAATTVSFTLTNTGIAATDVVILNHISGGTVGAYTLNAQPAAGSAVINVRNITAGSLSEAIVIRYTVIKGVSA